MVTTTENISIEFGKAWRDEFDELPLGIEGATKELLLRRAKEYKPYRLLAMWVMYLKDSSEKQWGIDIEKFLTTKKLNKWAVLFAEEEKVRKARSAEIEAALSKPKPLTPDEEFAQAVAYYKALCAKCSREALHEILFKTCSPPWFWDMAGLERPPEVEGKLLYKPDSRDFNCRVDAIGQYLEKGYIEWGEVDNAWMKVSVLKGAGKWTGQNLGKGFWCPSLGMTVRIDIGELPEEPSEPDLEDSTCGLMNENDNIDFF